jgi:mannose-6-phosphate isomerase-like protein (cupin superfamily)
MLLQSEERMMNNVHDILKNIPHEQIRNVNVMADERFDIVRLGAFQVEQSFLNHLIDIWQPGQPIEEIIELVALQPNTRYRPHYHENSSALIYMISGEGVLILDENIVPYQPGQRLDIPAKAMHGFLTNTRTLFLSIQSPPILNHETKHVDLHYVQEK